MSREKIEEIAEFICYSEIEPNCETCYFKDKDCRTLHIGERLYNAGYRKQEWISVVERLPETYEDVLYFNGQSVGVDFICSDGTWCDEEIHGKPITHWMPLPEAPKMKGGAE